MVNNDLHDLLCHTMDLRFKKLEEEIMLTKTKLRDFTLDSTISFELIPRGEDIWPIIPK